MKTIIDFFTGVDGEKSSKRLFLFILIICFATYFIANLFFGKVLKDSLEDNLFYLIIVMFLGITAERWKPTGK
jgi:hypothetical protein